MLNLRNENAPFIGDYTGREDIGKPVCAHISQRFRGKPIRPIQCLRFAETKGYCHLHDSQQKRNLDK